MPQYTEPPMTARLRAGIPPAKEAELLAAWKAEKAAG